MAGLGGDIPHDAGSENGTAVQRTGNAGLNESDIDYFAL